MLPLFPEDNFFTRNSQALIFKDIKTAESVNFFTYCIIKLEKVHKIYTNLSSNRHITLLYFSKLNY
jgi:hypothetical protein